MPKQAKRSRKRKESRVGPPTGSMTPLGFEQTLWQAAEQLRNNMDAAEYKHVVLGLMFVKFHCDAFDEHHARLERDPSADPEDPRSYAAAGCVWLPPDARWASLQAQARQPTIGASLDTAMAAVMSSYFPARTDGSAPADLLPVKFARPALDQQRLGELVVLIGSIALGDAASRKRDLLGRVYEYFLGQFALAEGKHAGQYFTPHSVVRTLVEMLAPNKGCVFDPCCGSGGMFVAAEQFVESHGGRPGDISIFGQESNATTWRLARMNLAIRGIVAKLGDRWADSFRQDLHPQLKADYILSNPPFNARQWSTPELLERSSLWPYGVPPANNANFAWIQHFLRHLAPTGMAAFVLANGSMSAQQSGEGEIRRNIVEADLVDCIVALPAQLFYSTQIPVCVWVLARKKPGRAGQTLFIDARALGTMVDRVHRELSDQDVARIATTYRTWRGSRAGAYVDVSGFCKSVRTEEIAAQQWVLTPSRYVETESRDSGSESLEQDIERLVTKLDQQMREGARLDAVIRHNLQKLGHAR